MMRKDISRKDIIEEIPYSGSSRMELKRSHHQWLTEESSSELFSNKRQQVVEIDAHMNLSPWDTSLVPSHFTDCLFDDPAIAHTSHLLRNGRNYTEEQCNPVSSFGLPLAAVRRLMTAARERDEIISYPEQPGRRRKCAGTCRIGRSSRGRLREPAAPSDSGSVPVAPTAS